MLNKIALLISTIFNLKYDIAPDIDATETQTKLVPTAILFSQPKISISKGPIMNPPPAPTRTPDEVARTPSEIKLIISIIVKSKIF